MGTGRGNDENRMKKKVKTKMGKEKEWVRWEEDILLPFLPFYPSRPPFPGFLLSIPPFLLLPSLFLPFLLASLPLFLNSITHFHFLFLLNLFLPYCLLSYFPSLFPFFLTSLFFIPLYHLLPTYLSFLSSHPFILSFLLMNLFPPSLAVFLSLSVPSYQKR